MKHEPPGNLIIEWNRGKHSKTLVARNVQPNYPLLQAALDQHGPWQGQSGIIDPSWLRNALAEKITSIDWKEAREDVIRFLNAAEQQSLMLWGERFFLKKVERL